MLHLSVVYTLLPRVAVPTWWALLALVKDARLKICNGGDPAALLHKTAGRIRWARIVSVLHRCLSRPRVPDRSILEQ